MGEFWIGQNITDNKYKKKDLNCLPEILIFKNPQNMQSF